MGLENKTVCFFFTEDFYIKENLLYELKRFSKINNIKIIPMMRYIPDENKCKITKDNIIKIETITKNKVIFYNKGEIINKLVKNVDIFILVCFSGEFIYKLANNIFDNEILKLINLCNENQKIVIIGINSNKGLFFNLKNIEKLYKKKYYYFIPIKTPNPITKPNLILFDSNLILKTTELAIDKIQIEPLISTITI